MQMLSDSPAYDASSADQVTKFDSEMSNAVCENQSGNLDYAQCMYLGYVAAFRHALLKAQEPRNAAADNSQYLEKQLKTAEAFRVCAKDPCQGLHSKLAITHRKQKKTG